MKNLLRLCLLPAFFSGFLAAAEFSASHDPLSRRTEKRANGHRVKAWLWIDSLRIVAELDAANAVTTQFIHTVGANIPAYIIKDADTFRLITDTRGSVRLVVNVGTGVVVQRMDYDEWGRVTRDTNPGFQPFGFAGGLYDPNTGLVHFGARDYDPRTARWTAKDPVGYASDQENLYAYASNDPVNGTDPLGLWPRKYEPAPGDEGKTRTFYLIDGRNITLTQGEVNKLREAAINRAAAERFKELVGRECPQSSEALKRLYAQALEKSRDFSYRYTGDFGIVAGAYHDRGLRVSGGTLNLGSDQYTGSVRR